MIAVALLLVAQATIPFTTIARGPASGIETPRTIAIHSTEEWQKLWADHHSDRPLPVVDFARDMVLAVFLGSRPSAGYAVNISRVSVQNGSLVVDFAESAPPPDAMTAQMLTAPFHIIRIAKRPERIEFRAARR